MKSQNKKEILAEIARNFNEGELIVKIEMKVILKLGKELEDESTMKQAAGRTQECRIFLRRERPQ